MIMKLRMVIRLIKFVSAYYQTMSYQNYKIMTIGKPVKLKISIVIRKLCQKIKWLKK